MRRFAAIFICIHGLAMTLLAQDQAAPRAIRIPQPQSLEHQCYLARDRPLTHRNSASSIALGNCGEARTSDFSGSSLKLSIPTFQGMDQQDAIMTGGCGHHRPPDPYIAVSATHIVEVVNQSLTVIRKDNKTRVYTIPLNSDPIHSSEGLFECAGAGNSIFDPKVIFDPQTARFFVVALEAVDASNSFIYLAFSNDASPDNATPTNDWTAVRMPATNVFSCTTGTTYTTTVDYPSIAVETVWVRITANMFVSAKTGTCPLGIGDVSGVKFRTLNKNALLLAADCNQNYTDFIDFDDQELQPNSSNGRLPFTAQPAQTIDGSTAGGMYYVSSPLAPIGECLDFIEIRKISISGTTATRSYFALPVPAFENPSTDIAQSGSSETLDALDGRLINAVLHKVEEGQYYINDRVYFAHAIRDPLKDKNLVRWYCINTNNWELGGSPRLPWPSNPPLPTLEQDGDIDFGLDVETWMPSVAINGFENLAIVYARCSASTFPSLQAIGRKRTDPPGVLGSAVTLTESNTFYSDTPCTPLAPPQRWGDYYAAIVDRNAAGPTPQFWGVGQYVESETGSDFWLTRIGKFNFANVQQ